MQFLIRSLKAPEKVSMKVQTYNCPLPELPDESEALATREDLFKAARKQRRKSSKTRFAGERQWILTNEDYGLAGMSSVTN
jgi:hypothetical protein